jgi:ankyrin repeat protein
MKTHARVAFFQRGLFLRLFGVMCASALVVGATSVAPDSRLADAAMKGDIAAVRALLKQRADVNGAQGDGMTALHWAAERGDSAIAALLVGARANVDAVTRIADYTPLHIAGKTGSAGVVSVLLKAGASPKAVTNSGATALHFAAAAGSADAVVALIKAGADPNAREATWGQTPLIFAAAADRPTAITALIKNGADPSDASNLVILSEQSGLDGAASRRRSEALTLLRAGLQPGDTSLVAQALLAAGNRGGGGGGRGGGGGGGGRRGGGRGGGRGGAAAAPVVLSPADSAAAAAAAAAAAERAALLASVPTPPLGPVTPELTQKAIEYGRTAYTDAVRPALVTDAEPEDTTNGSTAGFAGSVGAMGDMTPLHHAARQGNVAAVEALLDGGADINQLGSGHRVTPLLEAAINGQFDVAMVLINRGADPKPASITGDNALYATVNAQWAMRTRFPQPQATQFQKTTYLEVMEGLLKAGANPNARMISQPFYFAYNNCGSGNCGLENTSGTTPFWRAAYSVDVDAMRLLVKYGADPRIPAERPAGGGGRGGRGGGGGGGGGGAGAADPVNVAGLVGAAGAGRAGAAGRQGRAGRAGRGGGAAVADTAAVAVVGGRAGAAFAQGGRGGGGRGGPGGGGDGPVSPADTAGGRGQVGVGVPPIIAAAGVGYGNGFAGNSHRPRTDGWMPAMKYLVEELGQDVNTRDANGYTPLHHAAARGDNEMILYLVEKGADPKAVATNGRTTVDMANGPVTRLTPFPDTIRLLESMGAKNNHRCVNC